MDKDISYNLKRQRIAYADGCRYWETFEEKAQYKASTGFMLI